MDPLASKYKAEIPIRNDLSGLLEGKLAQVQWLAQRRASGNVNVGCINYLLKTPCSHQNRNLLVPYSFKISLLPHSAVPPCPSNASFHLPFPSFHLSFNVCPRVSTFHLLPLTCPPKSPRNTYRSTLDRTSGENRSRLAGPSPYGRGCQNRFGIPFWSVGEFTTRFRTYFSGWIGKFTGGTIWNFEPWPYPTFFLRNPRSVSPALLGPHHLEECRSHRSAHQLEDDVDQRPPKALLVRARVAHTGTHAPRANGPGAPKEEKT